MEFTLLGAVAVAVTGIYGALWWEAKRGNVIACTTDLWDLALASIGAGVLVGRLGAMVLAGVNPLSSPGDILIFRSGVDTGIAAIAGLAAIAWLARSEFLPAADGLAAAGMLGLAGWHGGCVVRGACAGTATDVPWAIQQAGSAIGRHPVEIYAAGLFVLVSVGIVTFRSRRFRTPGLAAAMALTAAGLIRLVTEPMRLSLTGGPVVWYAVATVSGLAAMLVLRRQLA